MKIKSLVLISSPVIIASSVLGTVYVIKNRINHDNKRKVVIDGGGDVDKDGIATSRFDKTIKYKRTEIFPKLRISDMYEFIEVKDGKAFLSNEIIARIIKIVVSGLGVTFGELKFDWQFITPQHIYVKAFWYERKGDIKNGFKYLLSINYSVKIIDN